MSARRASGVFVECLEAEGVRRVFGIPGEEAAWRWGSADDFGQHLRHALGLDVPSLIVVPVDYSIDVAISDELGEETVIRI